MEQREYQELECHPAENVAVSKEMNLDIGQFYSDLSKSPSKWLVTGCAGFVGTNLVKKLLELNQKVIGLDNFSLGLKENVELLVNYSKKYSQSSFSFAELDICNLNSCLEITKDVDHILHQAALGSVPRSLENPIASHNANVTGLLNMLWASKCNGIKSFVYASSSSVYGDDLELPKKEQKIGEPLSPYAATKKIDEIYAQVFKKSYDFNSIGLRYFNVFGPHQRPNGPYAAVIPKWIQLMLEEQQVEIYGDGKTSRDFCFIENVIQMNLLSAKSNSSKSQNQIYNVAFNQTTSLNDLYIQLKEIILECLPGHKIKDPVYKDFRPGDVKSTLADITKAQALIGYKPTHNILQGLQQTVKWYIEQRGVLT